MPDQIFTRPLLTYPVAYSGTLNSSFGGTGPEMLIPKRHKRDGDDYENKIVEYFITFGAIVAPSYVSIFDNNNTEGVHVYGSNFQFPIRLAMDSDLRMKATSADIDYYVMAFYEMPPGR